MGGYNPIIKSHIETLGFNPKYVLDKTIFSSGNKAILGMDFYRYDFNSDTFDTSIVKQSDNYVRKISKALYFQDELALTQKFTLTGGYRYEEMKYNFNYNDYTIPVPPYIYPNSPVDSKISLKATAYNVGLTYKYDQGNIYINHSKGFRSPATDEYFVYGVFNPDLKQQDSKNYEVGLHHKLCEFLDVSISGYLMNLKNELYYNPASYTNENYDKTRHQGIEAGFSSRLPWRLKFSGNYTFDQAVFKEGNYKGKDVPMVPAHKFNLGLMHFFTDSLSGGFSFNYMSSRRFINDEANNFPSLKQSFTVDTKLAFEKNDYKISGGINNLFNEKYYDYGVCNSTYGNVNYGHVNYYPAIGRNFFLKVSKKF